MKKLILIAAALAFAAAPAMAESMSSSGLSPMSFGPNETRSQGIGAAPYPHDQYAAGDMDSDSGHLHEHDVTSSAHANFALGDMDSDSGPSTAG